MGTMRSLFTVLSGQKYRFPRGERITVRTPEATRGLSSMKPSLGTAGSSSGRASGLKRSPSPAPQDNAEHFGRVVMDVASRHQARLGFLYLIGLYVLRQVLSGRRELVDGCNLLATLGARCVFSQSGPASITSSPAGRAALPRRPLHSILCP